MGDKKTLLPELLPAPPAGRRAGSAGALPPSPVERVAEQARLMLQRFRGLGPVASAAVLGLHCGGYGVVDPLPPPPVQCTTLAMPFTSIVATASFGNAVDAGVTPVVVTLRGAPYRGLLGLRVDAVRVTSGTLLGQTSGSTPGPAPGNEFVITIAPDAGTMMFLLDVDLGCGDATTTKHYRVIYFAGGYPSVDEVPASAARQKKCHGLPTRT